tara:strand:- start:287 stop:1723 length:1437 start_codon:yes stop_codon:yes gene_type:complete
MANASFSLPSEFTPYASRVATTSNYLNFHGAGGGNWSQQYLPELYAQEVERYGNRSISSFLRMVGAEMPMASDQVIWSEQGRLHLAYEGASIASSGEITIANSGTHAVRIGQTVLVKGGGVATPVRAYVSAVNATNTKLTVIPYSGAATYGALTGFDASKAVDFFVFGSEFVKGDNGMTGAVTPEFQSFTNKPIILKDKFEIFGSDTAQIGWVEVSGEGGQAGYLWYLKAEGDTRVRFEDYLEMAMVEAEKSVSSGGTDSILGDNSGTEGLFKAVESRGIVATNAFDSAAFVSTSGQQTLPEVITDFDLILKELDKQGAIEENMLFLNRSANLSIDDGLANISAGSAGGTAYGVFENSEDMAINLGFRGFRRGSYDFYKTDWKYLNNKSTRGLFDDIKGIMVPAGTSSVYDQIMGKNVRRPFLHVRYRASEADDRRMKSWIRGSVGGASSSDKDIMEIHYLSERCLVTQAANNFVLFK